MISQGPPVSQTADRAYLVNKLKKPSQNNSSSAKKSIAAGMSYGKFSQAS